MALQIRDLYCSHEDVSSGCRDRHSCITGHRVQNASEYRNRYNMIVTFMNIPDINGF